MNPDSSWFEGSTSGFWLTFGNQRADFALHRVQSPAEDRCHLRQVVSNQGKGCLCLHLGQANKTGFAKATHRLRPTEKFFNAFAQANPVTRMPGGPPINRAMRFLGNVRRQKSQAHRLDETHRVVIFISAQGRTPLQRAFGHHRGGFALCLAGGQCRFTSTAKPFRFSISAWPM